MTIILARLEIKLMKSVTYNINISWTFNSNESRKLAEG
jgi:hypothetical protein